MPSLPHENWHVNEVVERIGALMHDALHRLTHHVDERITHMNQQLQTAIDGVKASVDAASVKASAEAGDISAKVALVIQNLPTSGATQADVDAAVAQLSAIQAQADTLATSIENLSDAVVAPSEPAG